MNIEHNKVTKMMLFMLIFADMIAKKKLYFSHNIIHVSMLYL